MLRGGRLLVVAVVLSLTAVACGTDGFTYVENEDEGLYFKVPDDWVVSESRGVIETPSEQLQRNVEAFNDPGLPRLPDPWRVSIEALSPTGRGPTVLVEVMPVGSDLRDDLSVRSMKAMATPGIDPTSEGAAEAGITVVYDQDLVSGDLSGNRLVVDRELEGGQTFTVDQIIYVDPSLTRLYRMFVACTRSCYLDNFDEIDDVINSFTVES